MVLVFSNGVKMGIKFWLKRTATVFLCVLVILVIVELLKGHTLFESVIFALLWSTISTTIFIATRLYYSRKGVACDLCNDNADKSTDK